MSLDNVYRQGRSLPNHVAEYAATDGKRLEKAEYGGAQGRPACGCMGR